MACSAPLGLLCAGLLCAGLLCAWLLCAGLLTRATGFATTRLHAPRPPRAAGRVVAGLRVGTFCRRGTCVTHSPCSMGRMARPRVAFFPDSFHEVNGVAAHGAPVGGVCRTAGIPAAVLPRGAKLWAKCRAKHWATDGAATARPDGAGGVCRLGGVPAQPVGVPAGAGPVLRSVLLSAWVCDRAGAAGLPARCHPHHRTQRAGAAGRVVCLAARGAAGGELAYQCARVCGTAAGGAVADLWSGGCGGGPVAGRADADGVGVVLPAGTGAVRAESRRFAGCWRAKGGPAVRVDDAGRGYGAIFTGAAERSRLRRGAFGRRGGRRCGRVAGAGCGAGFGVGVRGAAFRGEEHCPCCRRWTAHCGRRGWPHGGTLWGMGRSRRTCSGSWARRLRSPAC